ncbi:MAG: hypothetical protein JWM85_1745 [Acidimicrobiaceae bacterium]|nr:hypothetical protein [Acidimicrobiaceae bacterium]
MANEERRPPGRPPGAVGGSTMAEEPGLRPKLSGAQLEVLGRYGTQEEISQGEVLFSEGGANGDFLVVLGGTVDVIERFGRECAAVVMSYGPSEFMGELGLVTGQRTYFTGVATSAGSVLRIRSPDLRDILDEEPALSELILRAFLLRRTRLRVQGSGLTLVGSRFDPETRRLLGVLARNRVSSRWLELESAPEAEAILQRFGVHHDELPLVVAPNDVLLRKPSNRELLEALGLAGEHHSAEEEGEVCDLLVIGGGPAGLAAAVYGASEGMATTLAEESALGGQAGTSSRIENYLGFPAGLSGDELTARAALQARKFGVRMKGVASAAALTSSEDVHQVRFEDGEVVRARAVIIATGAHYNRLPLEGLERFEGVGVYYAATLMEAQACAGGSVVIVGGGNSAGQAALYLTRSASRVHLVVRRENLAETMSRYLIDQIEKHPNLTVHSKTEVTGLLGEDRLTGVTLRNGSEAAPSPLEVCGLFVFIGAAPCTAWLAGQLAEDKNGFLLTGDDVPPASVETGHEPLLLETSRPGIFCVGDARSRSVKRVAAAIGEGSMAVRLVFDRFQAAGLSTPSLPVSTATPA